MQSLKSAAAPCRAESGERTWGGSTGPDLQRGRWRMQREVGKQLPQAPDLAMIFVRVTFLISWEY